MTGIDMSVYDAMKPSINQYINLLKEFGLRLTNLKSHKIMLETRKTKAFEVLSEKIKELEGEEQVQKWKDKLENVFPKKNTHTQAEFIGYNVGDVVICFTDYSQIVKDGYKYYMSDYFDDIYVKCKIQKINKDSITLVKYKCVIDYSDHFNAMRNKTVGEIKLEWTTLGKQTEDVKDLSKITRKCDDLEKYKRYCKGCSYRVDHRNI